MDRKLSLIIQFGALDKLSGTLRSIVGLGEKGTTALARMKREARDLDNQLRATQKATAAGTGNVTALIAEERRLEGAIARTNREIDRRKRLITIDNRVAAMQARGAALQTAGQNNMIGGASMLAPFVLAGRDAMNFSSGMVDIQLKAQLTNAELGKMRGQILRAAAAAHQLPEDMRAAVDVLSGFGMDPRQAVRLTQPIGRLGTAFKVELPDAAAAAYSGINSLKVPLGQVATMFDIMAAAGNSGAFEVKDMARWFPAITAQARALGQSGTAAVADLSAALQIARRGSADADEAGNNVVNLLAKINSPETIRKFSKNFGVDLPAAMKRAYAEGKTPLEAIALLSKQATGGDLEKLAFLFEDRQAASALRSLIMDMGDYQRIRAEIARSGGTVDSAFRTRQINDASIEWRKFRGQLGDAGITLGTTVLPAATKFLAITNAMLGGLSRWAQANPRAASTLFTLVGGLAAARVGLGALQFAFGGLLGPMATAWGWLARLAMGGRLAAGLGIARVAVMGLGRAFLMAGAAMLTTPIGWIIMGVAAVAAGAYLIYRNWGQIGPWFAGLWNRVKNTFATIDWGAVGKRVVFGIFFGLGLAWKTLTTWFFGAGTGLANILKGVDWGGVARWCIQTYFAGMRASWEAVKGWWNASWNALLAYVKGLGWSDVGRAIVTGIVGGLGGLLSGANLGAKIGTSIRGQLPSLTSAARAGWAAGTGKTPLAGKRALGGPVNAGRTYLVGEQGPELFVAPRSGGIVSNRQLRGQNDNARPVQITNHFTIQQRAGEDGEALARRVAELMQREAAQARRGAYYDA